ncbi:GntR family transcriptional regulator [Pelagerythrobacter aerophilus]
MIVRTLSDQVFEVLRDRIVSGQMGDKGTIRQDAIARELGVSKIPLREALVRLEQEGLLQSKANRGYMVRPMSAEEADEIFAMRLKIEPTAAGLGSERATEEERAWCKSAFERLDTAAADGTSEVAVRNREFHMAMVRPSGQPLTSQFVERLTVMSERYVYEHLKPSGRESRAHQEHLGLLDAWLARDAGGVEKLLTEHILGTLNDLQKQLAAGQKV